MFAGNGKYAKMKKTNTREIAAASSVSFGEASLFSRSTRNFMIDETIVVSIPKKKDITITVHTKLVK